MTAAALPVGQLVRYVIAGGTAAATHLLVLVLLVELAGCPATLASALGFAAATPVNYGLQHRFVFRRSGGHGRFFTRYLAVTAATMALNTALFALLAAWLPYLLAQVVTIGMIVLVNFLLNRHVTFRVAPA